MLTTTKTTDPAATEAPAADLSRGAKFLKAIPWDEVVDTLDELSDAGWEREAALDLVSGLLDQSLPFDTIIPGPVGVAVEAIDRPVFRAAISLAWSLAERRGNREERRAARKARRAQRRTERAQG